MRYATPKVKWWRYCYECGYDSPKNKKGKAMSECPTCGAGLITVTEHDSLKELLRDGKTKEA